MNARQLYTIKWTQPYANAYQRPYLRAQQENFEQLIEIVLENGDYADANDVIERIRNASKS